jgi:hypothetical protein
MKNCLAIPMMISSVTVLMLWCKKDVLPLPVTDNEVMAPVTYTAKMPQPSTPHMENSDANLDKLK